MTNNKGILAFVPSAIAVVGAIIHYREEFLIVACLLGLIGLLAFVLTSDL